MSEQTEEQTQGIRVFVYGSLKQGHCNYPALEDATFLGRCFLEGNYTMVDLGWYPAVVNHGVDGPVNRIFGEVYLVPEDTLYTLDCIEGHPTFYERRKIETPPPTAVTVSSVPTMARSAAKRRRTVRSRIVSSSSAETSPSFSSSESRVAERIPPITTVASGR